jgi:UDP-2,3-diacylglucosamine hydrolase
MLDTLKELPENKKLFFASDFHLGAPDGKGSRQTEKKVVAWLDSIKDEAAAIVLAGDIFDFWFEYKNAIPRGFIRLLGKLAEITDAGTPVVFFTGNHDMWMFDYFPSELNIHIYRKPLKLEINGIKLLVGHGDGLGPGDLKYKILKKIFSNKFCQWAFARLHPNFGIGLAKYWSGKSRISNDKINEFDEESDFLVSYCKKHAEKEHIDYYIFGHRHMPLEIKINESSIYINLGEWVTGAYYAEFDGQKVRLLKFESS